MNVILGPGINIKRTPLCGRNFEYLSEDPVLSGELAAALISSIEAGGVAATVKHFAVNNQEFDRMVVNAVVDDRALREIYLKGFEIAIGTGKPSAVMSAYNSVNGTPAVANPFLLTEVLRDEWGFTGIVMSDWGSVDDRVASLRAGLDLEMPGSNGVGAAAVRAALDAGEIEESVIDRSASRIIETARRFSPAEPADPTHDNSELRDLARQIAARVRHPAAQRGPAPAARRRRLEPHVRRRWGLRCASSYSGWRKLRGGHRPAGLGARRDQKPGRRRLGHLRAGIRLG